MESQLSNNLHFSEEDKLKTAASIYSQKFLSYLVILISILVIQLQILLQDNIMSVFLLQDNNILGKFKCVPFIFVIYILFIAFIFFAYLVFRTSNELYAIESKMNTIDYVINLAKEKLGAPKDEKLEPPKDKKSFNLWIYDNRISRWLFLPKERGLSIAITCAFIFSIIFDSIFCSLILRRSGMSLVCAFSPSILALLLLLIILIIFYFTRRRN